EGGRAPARTARSDRTRHRGRWRGRRLTCRAWAALGRAVAMLNDPQDFALELEEDATEDLSRPDGDGTVDSRREPVVLVSRRRISWSWLLPLAVFWTASLLATARARLNDWPGLLAVLWGPNLPLPPARGSLALSESPLLP